MIIDFIAASALSLNEDNPGTMPSVADENIHFIFCFYFLSF
jgi:hypothetical protein